MTDKTPTESKPEVQPKIEGGVPMCDAECPSCKNPYHGNYLCVIQDLCLDPAFDECIPAIKAQSERVEVLEGENKKLRRLAKKLARVYDEGFGYHPKDVKAWAIEAKNALGDI